MSETSEEEDFYELFYGEDWNAIEKIVQKDPEILHEPISHSDMPLHDIIRQSSPDPNHGIQRILQMDPTTAQDRTGWHSESRDYAEMNYSHRTIEALYGTGNEESVPGDGLIAAHLVVLNSVVTLETLKHVVEAYPEGLVKTDTHGNTPLHYAFLWFDKMTKEKRRYLIEANPAAAKMKSFNGSTPLHYGAQYGKASAETLRALYEAYPAAIQEKDRDGKTPLELAVEKKHEALANMLRGASS